MLNGSAASRVSCSKARAQWKTRRHELREVVNALLYQARTGVQALFAS
jgi:transposase